MKKVKIFKLAMFQAVLMAPLGLLGGLVYSFAGLISDIDNTGNVNLGTVMAFLAIIGMPIIFALVGFLLGIIEGLLFNLFSGCFKNLTIDFFLEE